MIGKENCLICYYNDRGFCKRYPPRVTQSMLSNSNSLNLWPVVSDGCWCGEFKNKNKKE